VAGVFPGPADAAAVRRIRDDAVHDGGVRDVANRGGCAAAGLGDELDRLVRGGLVEVGDDDVRASVGDL